MKPESVSRFDSMYEWEQDAMVEALGYESAEELRAALMNETDGITTRTITIGEFIRGGEGDACDADLSGEPDLCDCPKHRERHSVDPTEHYAAMDLAWDDR